MGDTDGMARGAEGGQHGTICRGETVGRGRGQWGQGRARAEGDTDGTVKRGEVRQGMVGTLDDGYTHRRGSGTGEMVPTQPKVTTTLRGACQETYR